MKAVDYFAKYKEQLIDPNAEVATHAAFNVISEMSDETLSIIEKRHIKKGMGLITVLKEMNQKYNTLVSIFEKEYGASPLRRDGFKHLWFLRMPELQLYWQKN